MDVSKWQEEIRETLEAEREYEEWRDRIDFLMWEQEMMWR